MKCVDQGGKICLSNGLCSHKYRERQTSSIAVGRPFLATGVALIDVKKGELTLRVGDEAVHFNLNDSLKQPELRSVDYEFVRTKIYISSELTTYCNF